MLRVVVTAVPVVVVQAVPATILMFFQWIQVSMTYISLFERLNTHYKSINNFLPKSLWPLDGIVDLDASTECTDGFERTSTGECVDIDECYSSNPCQDGYCVNTDGSYR